MNLSLRLKIIGFATVPVIFAMFIATVISVSSMISEGDVRVENYRERLLTDVKSRLKTRTEIAVNSIKKYYNESDSAASQEKAKEMVKNLKYGEKGYFWINDHYPKMIMHPYSPQLNGKSIREYKDPNGVFLFNEMVKAVEKNGEGYVPYMWAKPGFKDPQPKISYVMGFDKWKWIIGNGVYIDDIDLLVNQEKEKIQDEIGSMIFQNIIIGLILVLLICITAFVAVNRTICRRIYQLVNTLRSVEETADFSHRAEVESTDEIAHAKNAFNDLIASLQITITNLNEVLTALARGDLSKRVTAESKGDLQTLKISTNKSIEMLRQIILGVKTACIQVNTGAEELARSSQSLAAGSSQQAASAEEISASMNELGSQTRTNNENASHAKELTQQTLQVVHNGNEQMEELLTSMKDINDTSSEVSKIIKVIDEIAFQTNLLALNAAVEAARAGKYGKGFAVVAEEVRNLASRSAEAAKNTAELIETSVNRVESGVKNTDKTAVVLGEITTNMEKINDLVSEISSSSKEQTTGIDEVNTGLSQINDVIQNNSSISEQAASAAEELSALAMELQGMMNQFSIGETEGSPQLQQDQIKPATQGQLPFEQGLKSIESSNPS
jgi:methyl-accepting chemotaxis protein